jgi:hypothetical protein
VNGKEAVVCFKAFSRYRLAVLKISKKDLAFWGCRPFSRYSKLGLPKWKAEMLDNWTALGISHNKTDCVFHSLAQ